MINPYLTIDYTLDELDSALCALGNLLHDETNNHARFGHLERVGILQDDDDLHSGWHQQKANIEAAIEQVKEAIEMREGRVEARHIERERRILAEQQV